ncbi:MAG TPA: GPP34 family phosphoprotein [Micromonosporaceae bacterium]
MTVQTLRTATVNRLRRIVATGDRDQAPELPLRAKLFLITHHDKTGQRHIDQRGLELGLAGAVLLDLELANKVQIGWRCDARHGTWQQDPGRITVLNADPTGDPIADAALVALWRRDIPNTVKDFVNQFATTDLYERIRADLVAAGLLRRTTRRRFRLFRHDIYQAVDPRLPYRVRAAIRNAAAQFRPDDPDYHTLAQAGLITALGLTPYLFPPDMPTSRLQQRFHHIANSRPDPTVRDVATAISPHRSRRALASRRTGEQPGLHSW